MKPARAWQGIYGGREPEEIPVCTIRDAAAWLSVPPTTVRAWALGQAQGAKGRYEAIIEVADRGRRLLSFRNLVELHVLSALRRRHDVPMQSVREAVDFLKDRLGVVHPLADRQMFTLGRDLLVEQLGGLVAPTEQGQTYNRQIGEAYLRRVHRADDGHPIQLFPFSRPDTLDAPLSVVIDPRVQFGRPCLAGSGIPTAAIADRHRGGEDIADIAKDYRRDPRDVEEAIRFENRARAAA